MEPGLYLMQSRWPIFTKIYSPCWELVGNIIVISNKHNFSFVNYGFCYWLNHKGTAMLGRGNLNDLKLDWLDEYESKLQKKLSMRPVVHPGVYPSAAAIAYLRKRGVCYETPVDRYNSKKPTRARVLKKIDTICEEMILLLNVIWQELPQPIAEEIAPLIFTMHVYDREFLPR